VAGKVRRDIVTMRERDFPELDGEEPSPSSIRRKGHRKLANKRYRKSIGGVARRRVRDAKKHIESALVKEYMDAHPEYVEKLERTYFTRRIDGIGIGSAEEGTKTV